MNSDYLEAAERAFGFDDPSLAVGLNDIAFYSSELPFLNVLKQVGDSGFNDGAWEVFVPDPEDGSLQRFDYSEAYHAGFLDENGYIQDLPEGASARLFLFNSLTEEAGTGGRYIFSFEGDADFKITGGVVNEELSEPGRFVVDIEDATAFGLTINETDPANNLRNLSLVREENIELFEAGAIFNPDFIELFDDHAVLRFMDWMETNNSNQINFSDLATPDAAFFGIPPNQSYEYLFARDVPGLAEQLAQSGQSISDLSNGDFTQIFIDPLTGEPFRDAQTNEIIINVPPELLPEGIPTGVPIEILVELANQVGADPWFNIPHQASDEYVREFAEYVRDNLDPGLTARFEYSNEVWNAQFTQFHYANQQGLDLFGEDAFGGFPFAAYYGYRSAEILDLVNDVFAETGSQDRVHGILATQTVNFGITQQALEGVELYLNYNNQGQSVDDLFDSLAVTGYYGPVISEGTFEKPGHLALYQSIIDESIARFEAGQETTQYQYFIEQIAQDLTDSSVTNAFFAETRPDLDPRDYPQVFSLDELRFFFDFNGGVARENGLELVQYEGGSHILTSLELFQETRLLDFLAVLNDSPEIAQVNSDALVTFRQTEGATLANDFVGVAQRGLFGPFGSLENLNDSSPVFDSFNEFNLNAATGTQFGTTTIDQPFGSINEGRDRSAFLNGRTDTGSENDDLIIGSVEEDFLAGSIGNDTLVGGGGDDGLNGGEGFDIAVFSGSAFDHNFGYTGDGLRVVGLDGDDFLINIEAISFEDGETILVESLVSGVSPLISYFGGEAFTPEPNDNLGPVTIIALDEFTVTGFNLEANLNTSNVTEIIYATARGEVTQAERDFILNGAQAVFDSQAANFISNVTSITGTRFGDRFEGNNGGEIVDLGDGSDVLFGFGGDDTLSGNSGSDSLFGGNGNDVLNPGFGADEVDGGLGVDTVILNSFRTDNIVVREGNGVRIQNAGNDDFIQNVEFFQFLDGQILTFDQLFENLNPNLFFVGGGEYQAISNEGTGIYISSFLANSVTGNELGVDANSVVPTQDAVYFVTDSDFTFDLFEQINSFGVSNALNFVDLIANTNSILGTEFNDIFIGLGSAERVSLGDGNDNLSGLGGDDTLDGGAGDDVINGGAGADRLIAGEGNDTIIGGDGIDVLVLEGSADDYFYSTVSGGVVIFAPQGEYFVNSVENVVFDDGNLVTLQSLIDGDTTPSSVVTNLAEQNYFATGDGASGVTISFLDINSQTAQDLNIPASGFTSTADTVFFVADIGNADASLENINGGVDSASLVVDLVTNPGTFIGTGFDDVFEGSVGDESVELRGGNDSLNGAEGNDTLSGDDGNDSLSGGLGSDQLSGGTGNDFISGGVGDDLIFGGLGNDTIDGGEDFDTLSFENVEGSVVLNFSTGVHGGVAAGDVINRIEAVIGTSGNDTIIAGGPELNISGGIGDDSLIGGSGNNVISGGSGRDTLFGGGGHDLIDGGSGEDILLLQGSVNDYTFEETSTGFLVTGLEGSDTLTAVENVQFSNGEIFNLFVLANPTPPSTTSLGGGSFDGVSTGPSGLNIGVIDPNGITASDFGVSAAGFSNNIDTIYFVADADNPLATSETINGGSFSAVEVAQFFAQVGSFNGTQFDDSFTGSVGNEIVDLGAGNDQLFGLEGNDSLSGGSGNDVLNGGVGNDTLVGGTGADTINGGAGTDTLSFANAVAAIGIDFTNSSNNSGAATGDVVSDIEVVVGSAHDDSITLGSTIFEASGGSGNDVISGGNGNHSLFGEIGDDTLIGGAGDDFLDGGADNDLIQGGAGADIIIGGFGRDTVSFENSTTGLTLDFIQEIFTGDAAGDSVFGIEAVIGSQGDDLLILNGDVVDAEGGNGADNLIGTNGNNVLVGGSGDDTLNGRIGNDVIIGGEGEDLAILAGSAGDYIIEQNADGFLVTGIDGVDSLVDVENVQFADGTIISLIDWVGAGESSEGNQTQGEDESETDNNSGGDGEEESQVSVLSIEGNTYQSESDGVNGVFIRAIAPDGATATDLGVSADGFEGAFDTIFSVTSTGNLQATEDFINSGAANAQSIGLLITQVGDFVGTQFNDDFDGSVGNDRTFFGDGNDTIDGRDGNDTLFGENGNDLLIGGNGDDFISGGRGADVISGGAGFDTLSFADASEEVTVDFIDELNQGDAAGDAIFGIEAIIGTSLGDTFILGETVFDVNAGNGNDSILGGDIVNHLNAGAGNDTVEAAGGDDVIIGGSGFDLLNGGGDNDSIFGGQHADNLVGGNGDDDLFGEDGADRLFGGDGEDLLSGGSQSDVLFGGLGDDELFGDDDNDRLSGNAGQDRLFGGDGNDRINGNSGHDFLVGGAGNDRLSGDFNRDTLFGGEGDDTLFGGEGPDLLFGEAGNDLLAGGGGSDVVDGGAGDDHLIGFSGFDTLTGGEGNDILEGRFNADQFVFADGFGNDIITDFEELNNAERIDLSDVTEITDFEDLIDDHLIVGADGFAQIVVGSDSITLNGVDVADLDESDFIF